MPRFVSWKSTVFLLLLLCLFPAFARAVVVPDNYPTIQAALDAGASLIEVRDGLAPERLHVSHSVVIRGNAGTNPYLGLWFSSPHVRSLDITTDQSIGLEVHDIRFLGNVVTDHLGKYGDGVTFEGCRFDSSLVGVGDTFSKTSVRHCMIVGSVDLRGYVQFVGNTVLGGTVKIWADGVHDIRDNYVQGPAAVGMDLTLQDSIGQVDMNTVRGATDGIVYLASSAYVTRNDIANCSGDGIRFVGSFVGHAEADSNTIADCSGAGISLEILREPMYAGASVNGNLIRRTGKEGMRLPGAILYTAIGNTILDSGRDGVIAGLGGDVRGNVIGRSNGDGLILTEEPYRVIGNTFFSNRGVGLRFSGAIASFDSVQRNISAFNGGAGGVSTDGSAPYLGCNDWFGNAGGSVIGFSAGPSDLSVNPLFCDLGAGDVHLSSESSLASNPGCGLIGALGIGCGPVTAVPSEQTRAPVGFSAWPIPSRGTVAFSIPPSGSSAEIEVFDLTGARRWQSTIPSGTSYFSWTGHDASGGQTPPGVYFARLRQGDRELAHTRIILTK